MAEGQDCFICSMSAPEIDDITDDTGTAFPFDVQKFVKFLSFRRSDPFIRKRSTFSLGDLSADPEFKNFRYCHACKGNLIQINGLLEELELIQNSLVEMQQSVAGQLKEAVQSKTAEAPPTRVHWYRGRILEELESHTQTLTTVADQSNHSHSQPSEDSSDLIKRPSPKLQPVVKLIRLEHQLGHQLEGDAPGSRYPRTVKADLPLLEMLDVKQELEDEEVQGFDDSFHPTQDSPQSPEFPPSPPPVVKRRGPGRPRKHTEEQLNHKRPNKIKSKPKPKDHIPKQKPKKKADDGLPKRKRKKPKPSISELVARRLQTLQKSRESLAVDNEEPKLNCANCEATYSLKKLWIHTKLDHEDLLLGKIPFPESKTITKFKFQCKFCSLPASALNVAWFHMRCQHSKHVIRDYEKLYPPGSIAPSIKDTPPYKNRKEVKRDPGPFQCDRCPRVFKRGDGLRYHIRTAHEKEASIVCTLCPYRCLTTSQLRAHVGALHKLNRDIICEVCGKRFHLQHRLNEHMRKHTGEKPYACRICGKKYALSNLRSVHEATHSGARPHACELCGFRFPTRTHLWSHHQSHHVRKGAGPGVAPKRSTKYNLLDGAGGDGGLVNPIHNQCQQSSPDDRD